MEMGYDHRLNVVAVQCLKHILAPNQDICDTAILSVTYPNVRKKVIVARRNISEITRPMYETMERDKLLIWDCCVYVCAHVYMCVRGGYPTSSIASLIPQLLPHWPAQQSWWGECLYTWCYCRHQQILCSHPPLKKRWDCDQKRHTESFGQNSGKWNKENTVHIMHVNPLDFSRLIHAFQLLRFYMAQILIASFCIIMYPACNFTQHVQ